MNNNCPHCELARCRCPSYLVDAHLSFTVWQTAVDIADETRLDVNAVVHELNGMVARGLVAEDEHGAYRIAD